MNPQILIAIMISLGSPTWAQDKTEKKQPVAGEAKEEDSSVPIRFEALKSIDYPELQVVPRASERLKLEAQNEPTGKWFVHWPFQIAGIANMFLGSAAKNYYRNLTEDEEKDADSAAQGATTIGAAWLVGMTVYGAIGTYTAPYNYIKRIPEGDRRNELRRERFAEEALEKPARTVNVLRYISTITNLGAALYVGAFTKETGSTYAAIAAALSFTPFLFEHHQVHIYNKHQEYKKKIYRPVSYFEIRPVEKSLVPVAGIQWTF